MHCVRCSKEMPIGASHCPYCGADVVDLSALQAGAGGAAPQQALADRPSFCVKCGASIPPHAAFCTQCSTPRPNIGLQRPTVPSPAMQPLAAGLVCARCGSANVTSGKMAQWALIAGIVLALFTCGLSLLLLLVKDPNRCLNCGFEFK